MHPPIAPERPTRTRRVVVGFGALLAFLAYIDRVAISQAAPAMARDLALGPIQLGYVFSAFGLAYAALEIPSGWLCDRIGPRKVLTRVVLWWSLFTATTGLSWNFHSLLVTRLLFGAGEAGCFPGLAKMFRNWLPRGERPLAEGIKATSARWGAAVTPFLIVSLYRYLTWRQTFFLLGSLGLLWAAAFFFWFRDHPHQHASVNRAERMLMPPPDEESGRPAGVPWRFFLRSGSAWALCLQWFCHYYGFYFYITWLPTYLHQARGLDLRRGALLAGLPMLLAGCGSLFSGWMLPKLVQACGSVPKARRIMGYLAYGGAGALLLLFTSVPDPFWAVLVMSLSSFAAELSAPISWTTVMDLGGRHVGTLSAAMNMMGHFGGSVAPAAIGYILAASAQNWTLTFYTSAAIYGAGALCWMAIRSDVPLDGR